MSYIWRLGVKRLLIRFTRPTSPGLGAARGIAPIWLGVFAFVPQLGTLYGGTAAAGSPLAACCGFPKHRGIQVRDLHVRMYGAVV